MAFPFNLLSIDWKAAPLVPEWLAALTDDLPLVREEAFAALELALSPAGGLAPAAGLAVAPLLRLTESEPSKGRALAAMLLANLALAARARAGAGASALLEHLEPERSSLELLTTRHDASTPFGAALRALIAVLVTPNASTQFVEHLAAVEAVVREADGRDEAPAPTLAQVKQWVDKVRAGEGHALGLAQRALPIDARGALQILQADPTPGTTSVQRVKRAVMQVLCLDAIDEPVVVVGGPWSGAAQALLLDAAERHCVKAPKVGLALLEQVTDGAHAIRRRAVGVRVHHAAQQPAAAWALADGLAAQWLEPSRAGGVNQSLSRSEVLTLLQLFANPDAAARAAQVRAAPAPQVAVPEGDVL